MFPPSREQPWIAQIFSDVGLQLMVNDGLPFGSALPRLPCHSTAVPTPNVHSLHARFYFWPLLRLSCTHNTLISGPELALICFWWSHSCCLSLACAVPTWNDYLDAFPVLSSSTKATQTNRSSTVSLGAFCEITLNTQWPFLPKITVGFTCSSTSTFISDHSPDSCMPHSPLSCPSAVWKEATMSDQLLCCLPQSAAQNLDIFGLQHLMLSLTRAVILASKI